MCAALPTRVALCLIERETRPVAAAEHLSPPPAALQVLVTTSELLVGSNRFAFGLLRDGTLLVNANVAVRLYDAHRQPPQVMVDTTARRRHELHTGTVNCSAALVGDEKVRARLGAQASWVAPGARR